MLYTYSYYKHNTTPFRKKVKKPTKSPKQNKKNPKNPEQTKQYFSFIND